MQDVTVAAGRVVAMWSARSVAVGGREVELFSPAAAVNLTSAVQVTSPGSNYIYTSQALLCIYTGCGWGSEGGRGSGGVPPPLCLWQWKDIPAAVQSPALPSCTSNMLIES